MTNSDNQKYFIPMEVTKETIKDFNLDSSQVVPAKIGNKIVSAIMIPATKEQYDAYMQPLWASKRPSTIKRPSIWSKPFLERTHWISCR